RAGIFAMKCVICPLVLLLALTFWHAGPQTATAQELRVVTPLPYAVIDAKYSKTLDRIVTISKNPNTLHVFDPVAGTETGSVQLPQTPNAVSLSPDGLFAAVGYDLLVSYI